MSKLLGEDGLDALITKVKGWGVPKTRTINDKTLSSDIVLTPDNIGAVPTSRTINQKALTADITLTSADVGAAAESHTHTAIEIGAMPLYRELSSIGLTTTATIEQVHTALPTYSQLLVNWAGTDVTIGETFNAAMPTTYGSLRVVRYNETSHWMYTDYTYQRIYEGKYTTVDSVGWTDWSNLGSPASAVAFTIGSGSFSTMLGSGARCWTAGGWVYVNLFGYTGPSGTGSNLTLGTLEAKGRPSASRDSGFITRLSNGAFTAGIMTLNASGQLIAFITNGVNMTDGYGNYSFMFPL